MVVWVEVIEVRVDVEVEVDDVGEVCILLKCFSCDFFRGWCGFGSRCCAALCRDGGSLREGCKIEIGKDEQVKCRR